MAVGFRQPVGAVTDVYQLDSWRTEEGLSGRIEIEIGPFDIEVSFHGPVVGCYYSDLIGRDVKERKEIDVVLLERQLHVFLIIIVIEIFTPVVHGKILQQSYFRVECLVFLKMFEQLGQLDQLHHIGELTNQYEE